MPINNIKVLIGDSIYTGKIIRNPEMSNTQGISLGNTVIPVRGNFKKSGAVCVTTKRSGVPLIIPDDDEGNLVLFKVQDDRSIYVNEKKLKPFQCVMGWEIYNITVDEYNVITGKAKKENSEVESGK